MLTDGHRTEPNSNITSANINFPAELNIVPRNSSAHIPLEIVIECNVILGITFL